MSETVTEPAVEELVAGQRIKAIEALAHAGLVPDPITAAALFEIGSHLLVLQGLDPAALHNRLEAIVLRAGEYRQAIASTNPIH